MKMKTPALCVAIMLLALSGCKSASPTADRLLIDPLDAQRLGYGLGWVRTLGLASGDRVARALIIGDKAIIVDSPSNVVSAVALNNGDVLWRRRIADRTDRLFQPAAWQDKIVINSENELYLLASLDGAVEQVHQLEAVVNHGPAIVGDFAVFGGLNGRIFAHNLITGYPKWAYQMGGGIVAPPAAHEGLVLLGDTRGDYIMLNANTGDLLWRGRTFAQITARPALSALGAFVASHDQNLYALDRNLGRDKSGQWPYRTTQPLTMPPVLMGNSVFLPLPRQGLVAIDAVSGSLLWELPYLAAPITRRGQQLLLLLGNRIQFVEADTGQVVAAADVQQLHTILPSADGSLILVSTTGRLVRLIPEP